MVNAGTVVSKAQILVNVWDHDYDGSENVVELYIGYLRRKIDQSDPPLIHTRRGARLRAARRGRRMKRPPLQWLILVPTILTFTFGFGAFAVYIDGVERSNLLADIDDELIRAERAATIGDTGGNGADRANEGAPDGPRDSGGSDLADDVDPPVELFLSTDGELLRTSGGRNPFGDDVLQDLSELDGNSTVGDPNYRVRVTPGPDGTIAVTALSLDRLNESITDFRRTLLIGGAVILALVAGRPFRARGLGGSPGDTPRDHGDQDRGGRTAHRCRLTDWFAGNGRPRRGPRPDADETPSDHRRPRASGAIGQRRPRRDATVSGRCVPRVTHPAHCAEGL